MSRATKGKEVEIVKRDEKACWCRLEDGTVIEVTPVVAEVRKLGKDEYGTPIYKVNTRLNCNIKAPPERNK